MHNTLYTLAHYTLLSAWRKKVVLILLSVLLVFYAFSIWSYTSLIGSSIDTILFGILASYQFFTWLYIFSFLLPWLSEIKYHTLPYFLTRTDRAIMIYGLFFGSILNLVLAGILCWGLGILVQHFLIMPVNFLIPAFFSILVDGIFLIASTFLFWNIFESSLSYPLILVWYIIGYGQTSFLALLDNQTSSLAYYSLSACAYILPNLSALNIKSYIVYDIPYLKIPFFMAILHILLVSYLMIFMSIFLFRRKKI